MVALDLADWMKQVLRNDMKEKASTIEMHGIGPFHLFSVSFYFKFPHDTQIMSSEAKPCRKFHAVRFLHSFHISAVLYLFRNVLGIC